MYSSSSTCMPTWVEHADDARQTSIVGSEVVAPAWDAVCLVYNQQCHSIRHRHQPVADKCAVRHSLRRYQDHWRLATAYFLQSVIEKLIRPITDREGTTRRAWLHTWTSIERKTKNDFRQYSWGLWGHKYVYTPNISFHVGPDPVQKHCSQLGLPKRKDNVIVARTNKRSK